MAIKKLKQGEITRAAKALGRNSATVSKWHKTGKLNDVIKAGKIDVDRVDEAVKANTDIIRQKNAKRAISSHVRGSKPAPEVPPMDDDELEQYANKKGLPTFTDSQRAKIAYEAKLKELDYAERKKILVPVAEIEKRSFAAGQHIREGLESIADRCAPLVAVCPDQFECREILAKEINYVLAGLADVLLVTEG